MTGGLPCNDATPYVMTSGRDKDALHGKVEDPGRTCADNRLSIEAIMWVAKTGAPWRDLPPEYGKWSNVHK